MIDYYRKWCIQTLELEINFIYLPELIKYRFERETTNGSGAVLRSRLQKKLKKGRERERADLRESGAGIGREA
jgi:hypothetical protein